MKIDLLNIKTELLRSGSFGDDKYVRSYPHYVSYFREKEELTEVDLVRGVGFVYSWMPRIMGTISLSTKLLLNHLNEKMSGDNTQDFELFQVTHTYLSSSTVAASKLLHFIFPDSFPIYDSHIFHYCWPNQRKHHYIVKKIAYYHEYKLAVQEASCTAQAL
jgi:hypothetical protein